MGITTVQCVNMVFAGFAVDVDKASVRMTTRPKEAAMKSLPFGEAPNLAEELILGAADCAREGVMIQSMVVDGQKEIFVIFRAMKLAVPARVTSAFKERLPEPLYRISEVMLAGHSLVTLPARVPIADVESGK